MCEPLFTMQSYAIFRPIANFLPFISPTCNDNRPYRRQIKQTASKLVLLRRLFHLFLANLRNYAYLCPVIKLSSV